MEHLGSGKVPVLKELLQLWSSFELMASLNYSLTTESSVLKIVLDVVGNFNTYILNVKQRRQPQIMCAYNSQCHFEESRC